MKPVWLIKQLCPKTTGPRLQFERTFSILTSLVYSLRNDDYFPQGLSWIKMPTETLGITITDKKRNKTTNTTFKTESPT